MIAVLVLVGVLGLCVGSFLNVVIARLPDRRSLVTPASHCPHCSTPIKPQDNIPVLSWLLLRGRCRACGEPISVRYPAVELATAALLVLVTAVHGVDEELWLMLPLTALLVPVTMIDIDLRIIPNSLNAAGAIYASVVVPLVYADETLPHVLAALSAGMLFIVVILIYPSGMGMGDAKFAFVMGMFMGWTVWPAIFIALIGGAVYGIAAIAVLGVKRGRKVSMPFGPYLCAGALVGMLAGQQILDWYLNGSR